MSEKINTLIEKPVSQLELIDYYKLIFNAVKLLKNLDQNCLNEFKTLIEQSIKIKIQISFLNTGRPPISFRVQYLRQQKLSSFVAVVKFFSSRGGVHPDRFCSPYKHDKMK